MNKEKNKTMFMDENKMMRKVLFWITFLLCSIPTSAQESIDAVLLQIEENNTALSALRKQHDAKRIENQTGRFLPNPEVEFHYLWGRPTVIGDKVDFSLKQAFDFPTAYLHSKQIARFENEQVEILYEEQRKSLLLNAQMLCVELTYVNASLAEINRRLEHAEQIARAHQRKYETGETSRLVHNKSQLQALNWRKKSERTLIEREALLGELQQLNGGIRIAFSDSILQAQSIPEDFEQWYLTAEKHNDRLQWLQKEQDIRQQQVKLARSRSLPKLQMGYMQESVLDQSFQGLTMGMSIPLWENKNTIKQARVSAMAADELAADHQLQLYYHLHNLHKKVLELQHSVSDYRLQLDLLNNTSLLTIALEKGEISLLEYYMELSFYYDGVDQFLELQRELNISIASLNRYWL